MEIHAQSSRQYYSEIFLCSIFCHPSVHFVLPQWCWRGRIGGMLSFSCETSKVCMLRVLLHKLDPLLMPSDIWSKVSAILHVCSLRAEQKDLASNAGESFLPLLHPAPAAKGRGKSCAFNQASHVAFCKPLSSCIVCGFRFHNEFYPALVGPAVTQHLVKTSIQLVSALKNY